MTTLNVSGPSTLRDVSAQNIDISGTLHVIGQSNLKDVSAQNIEISGTLHGNVTSPNLVYITGDQIISGTKTFTNTINGNISGNAGSVTNGIYTSGGQSINGTTTLNNLYLNGQISALKFTTIKPVNERSNVFPGSSKSTSVTLADNIMLYGGTLVSHIQVGGFRTSTGRGIYTVSYTITSFTTTIRNITLSFFFNVRNTHQVWEITDVLTGLPSGSLRISLIRNNTQLRCDTNDFINITIQQKPY